MADIDRKAVLGNCSRWIGEKFVPNAGQQDLEPSFFRAIRPIAPQNVFDNTERRGFTFGSLSRFFRFRNLVFRDDRRPVSAKGLDLHPVGTSGPCRPIHFRYGPPTLSLFLLSLSTIIGKTLDERTRSLSEWVQGRISTHHANRHFN